MTSRRKLILATGAALMLAALPAMAAYPDKPIKVIVPWPPGGASDGATRLVARHLQDRLKQPVIIENKPGASGNIGADTVAKSPADGYTLLQSSGPFSINPSLYKKLPFDTAKDFVPVAQLTSSPSILLVHPGTPAKSMQEFVKLSRNAEKPMIVATPGNGSAQHLALELLKKKASLQTLNIPYKGGAPAMQDLLGGQVPAMMSNFTEALPYVKAGKLRALAVTTASRTPLLPDVPTLLESGLADSSTGGWNGIHAPAGTPGDVIVRLNKEINAVLDMPEVKAHLSSMGFDVNRTSQPEFARFVAGQLSTWKAAVELSGAVLE